MEMLRGTLREYNDLERDTETIHTIKNVFYAPNGDTDIAVVELQDSVNSCTESDRECWTISPLKLPAPELKVTPGQSVRTLGKESFWMITSGIKNEWK